MSERTEIEPYLVEIVDTATGERRTRTMDIPFILPDESGSGSVFWWEEGNFSCDCNRLGVWLDDCTPDDAKCGDGRFRVRCTTMDGRTELYRDDDFPFAADPSPARLPGDAHGP